MLEKRRARQVYEEVVAPQRERRLAKRDPGLLEQSDNHTFEMRVFPIPANGEQQIQITYYQPVEYDSGVVRYHYPLATKNQREVRMDVACSPNLDPDVMRVSTAR